VQLENRDLPERKVNAVIEERRVVLDLLEILEPKVILGLKVLVVRREIPEI
jgi:hypothetical protein